LCPEARWMLKQVQHDGTECDRHNPTGTGYFPPARLSAISLREMARTIALFPTISAALLAATLLAATPALARDSLGIFASWGTFRDPAVPRCYAIAMAEPGWRRRDYQPFATIGIWPRRGVRNQVHFRLSRKLAPNRR